MNWTADGGAADVSSMYFIRLILIGCDSLELHWLIDQCLTSPPTQYRLSGRQFYRSKDPTNSIKVLKEKMLQKQRKPRKSKQHKIQQNNKHTHTKNTENPLVIILWGDQGIAPTEGRVAKPERRWGCCGTTSELWFRQEQEGILSLVRLMPVWMTNQPPSVLWHCWLRHQTCKNIVPKMTYTVSSGTLNLMPCTHMP